MITKIGLRPIGQKRKENVRDVFSRCWMGFDADDPKVLRKGQHYPIPEVSVYGNKRAFVSNCSRQDVRVIGASVTDFAEAHDLVAVAAQQIC